MRRWILALAVSVSALPALAQDPPPAPAPTPAPAATPAPTPAPGPGDRVPLPAILDSWYKIEQDREASGWLHEKITTTNGSRTKYDYFLEAQFNYMVKLPSGEQNLSIQMEGRLQLEDDFDIYSGTWSARFNNASTVTIGVRTDDDAGKRTVNLSIPGESTNDPKIERELEMATEDSFLPFRSLLMFKLRQRGDLAQPNNFRLPTIPVAGLDKGAEKSSSMVQIRVTSMEDREVLGKMVKVTPVIVDAQEVDNLPVLNQFWIDKYGRLVEASVEKGTVLIKLAKDSEAAMSGLGGVPNRGWRDPFSKSEALTPIVKTKAKAGGTAEVKKTEELKPDELRKNLDKAKELIQDLRAAVSKNDQAVADATYKKFLQMHKLLLPQCNDPLNKTELTTLKSEAEKLTGGVNKLLQEAQNLVQKAHDAYQADQIERIDEILKQLAQLKERDEFVNDERIVEVDKASKVVAQKRAQAQARIELAKKQIELVGTITATEAVLDTLKVELVVGGARVAVVEPVKAVREVTYAVVNGEPYREGDMVPSLGVKIEKIHRHAIVISYKGEIREVPIKKN